MDVYGTLRPQIGSLQLYLPLILLQCCHHDALPHNMINLALFHSLVQLRQAHPII